MPSLVGIVLCMVCLAGTTWAWFSASVQTKPQTIQAADYAVTVSVTDETGIPIVPGTDGYALQGDTTYTIGLTAAGSAKGGGYGMIKTASGAEEWHTAPIKPGESLHFTLIPAGDAVYTITAVWGRCAAAAGIPDGSTIGKQTPDSGASPPEKTDPNGPMPSDSPAPSSAMTAPLAGTI